jgi:hypothetical protein
LLFSRSETVPDESDPMLLELVNYKDANDGRDPTTATETKLCFLLRGGQLIEGGVVADFNEARTVVYVHVLKKHVPLGAYHIRVADIAAIFEPS